MTEKSIYYRQDVAEKFHRDPFAIYEKTRQEALQQLQQLQLSDLPQVLDIGAGTGDSLQAIQQQFVTDKLYAMDISADMLALARKRLPNLETILGTIDQLPKHLAAETCDLVMSQFILAYVDADQLFQQAKRVLKPGGIYSIATTTTQCFGKTLERILRKEKSLLNKLTVRASRDNVEAERESVPKDMASFCDYAKQQGFKVLQAREMQHDLRFYNWRELWAYAYDAGWFINYLIERKITPFKGMLAFKLAQFIKLIQVPLIETSHVLVLTLQKQEESSP